MNRVQKILKDYYVRERYKKNEFKFLKFKYFQRELSHLDDFYFAYYIYFRFINWFKLTMSITRVRNLCIKTVRSRWVLRRFLLSRISFKEYMRFGKLQGVRKI